MSVDRYVDVDITRPYATTREGLFSLTSNLVQYVDELYRSADRYINVKAIFDFVAGGINISQTHLFQYHLLSQGCIL